MIVKDQLGRKINITSTPRRIVCLVPSLTELLVDLGLEDVIVGVTKFCVHPENIRKDKVVVGGTKHIHLDKIKHLKPDIVLCNKEENTKEIVTSLEEYFPVHVSDINTIDEAYDCIRQYGELFDVVESASTLIYSIETEKEEFLASTKNLPAKKVAYFIWKDPWIAVGSQTFIHHIMEIVKLDNSFGNLSRYPEVLLEDVKRDSDLDAVLLSSEPYPFKEKHKKELELFLENKPVILVDGEYFSWYGSRLKEAFHYFREMRLRLECM